MRKVELLPNPECEAGYGPDVQCAVSNCEFLFGSF